MTISAGAGEPDATIARAGVTACRMLRSSFGRAVLATRPARAGPDALSAVTASRADGAVAWVIVTGGPAVWPPVVPPMPARPHPASRTAAPAAQPIRPIR